MQVVPILYRSRTFLLIYPLVFFIFTLTKNPNWDGSFFRQRFPQKASELRNFHRRPCHTIVQDKHTVSEFIQGREPNSEDYPE